MAHSEILRDVKTALRAFVPAADFKVLATQINEARDKDSGRLISRHPTSIEVSYDKGTILNAGMNDEQVIAFVESILACSSEEHEIVKVTTLERAEKNKGRARPKPAPAVGIYVSESAYMNDSYSSPIRVTIFVFDGSQWFSNGLPTNADRVPADLIRLMPRQR